MGVGGGVNMFPPGLGRTCKSLKSFTVAFEHTNAQKIMFLPCEESRGSDTEHPKLQMNGIGRNNRV